MLTLFKIVKHHQNAVQILNLFFEIVDDSVYENEIMNSCYDIVYESALITFSVYLLISITVCFPHLLHPNSMTIKVLELELVLVNIKIAMLV